MLLDRLAVLGRGAEAAAGRRRWVEEEERRMGREQRAHVLALEQGGHFPQLNPKALIVKPPFFDATT